MKISLLLKYSILGMILIVTGIFVYLFTLDINQYKPMLISTVSTMTGRELRIDGELKLTPSLTPTISVQGITLANSPWSSSAMQLLTVGRVEAKAALLPLLSKRIQIEQFILH